MRYLYACLFVLVLSCDVQAGQCWQSRGLEQMVAERWHEVPVGHGLSDSGEMVRIYANPETGSWTMTVIRPDGRECVMSAGGNWRPIEVARDDT